MDRTRRHRPALPRLRIWSGGVLVETKEAVMKAIREKVLDSYRNGQATGPRKEEKVRRYAR